jgi:hypothetical protein
VLKSRTWNTADPQYSSTAVTGRRVDLVSFYPNLYLAFVQVKQARTETCGNKERQEVLGGTKTQILVAGRKLVPTWSHMHPLSLGPQPAGGWTDRQNGWADQYWARAPGQTATLGGAPARPPAPRSIVDWKSVCAGLRCRAVAWGEVHRGPHTGVTGALQLFGTRATERR